MIRTAGGPGLICPIDHAESRKPMPRWMALAIAGSVLAHAALGVVLYTQRFELADPAAAPPEPAPTVVLLQRRAAPPKPTVAEAAPPPLTAPLNRTAPPMLPTDTVAAAPVDAAPATGPLIRLAAAPEPSTTGATHAPVEAGPAAAPVIAHPAWRRRPTPEQLARAYPEVALQRGISGSATLTCTITAGGTVTTCRVSEETPTGHGFGRAAERLSRHFVMNPRTVDGTPVAGAEVSIPLRFDAPQ